VRFTKGGLAAKSTFQIKADMLLTTQLRTFSAEHLLPETFRSIGQSLRSGIGPQTDGPFAELYATTTDAKH